MNIFKANESHIDSWAILRNKLWPYSIGKHSQDIKDFLSDNESLCFIAEQENKTIAFIEASIRKYANGCSKSPVLFLEGIWVEKEYRRQKIAKALFHQIETWGKENGFTEICSDCDIDNQISIASHNSWGFKETERVIYFRKSITP